MKIPRWVKGVMASLTAVMALAWALTASGVVNWEVPFHSGMTKYAVLYASDTAHLRELAPGTSGQVLSSGGTAAAPSWVNGALGVGTGYKIARGQVVLDGSNPTQASHGLTTVDSCVLTNNRSSAIASGEPVLLTYATAATSTINIYAWWHGATVSAVTASTDSTDLISWLCVGT